MTSTNDGKCDAAIWIYDPNVLIIQATGQKFAEGATTFSVTTLSIMTSSMTVKKHDTQHNDIRRIDSVLLCAECR